MHHRCHCFRRPVLPTRLVHRPVLKSWQENVELLVLCMNSSTISRNSKLCSSLCSLCNLRPLDITNFSMNFTHTADVNAQHLQRTFDLFGERLTSIHCCQTAILDHYLYMHECMAGSSRRLKTCHCSRPSHLLS